MPIDPTAPPSDDLAEERPAWRRTSPTTAVCWLLFVGFAFFALAASATDDFTDRPLYGDQASHLLQGLSLAHDGHNLSFDEVDIQRWQQLGWTDYPNGLFTQQRADGWAFAKPYGYSVWLAPFLALFPAPVSVALANSVLLALYVALITAIVAAIYRGPVVPVVAGTFALSSAAVFYAFTTHSDLFLATLSAAIALCTVVTVQRSTSRPVVPATALVVLATFLITEKPPAAVLVAPIVIYVIFRLKSWAQRAALAATGPAVFVLFSLPYLYYSDWQAITPYGGVRYGVPNRPPFLPGGSGSPSPAGEKLSPGYIIDGLTDEFYESARAVLHYFVGRHTGMVAFFPVALALLVLALWVVIRRGRTGLTRSAAGLTVLGGLGSYILIYCLVFPSNYYGGGQSLGNRYFLQVVPFALLAVVLVRPSSAVLARVAAAAGVWALVVLSAHLAEPRTAFVTLDRTSAMQRLLPFETGADQANYFRCGSGVCPE